MSKPRKPSPKRQDALVAELRQLRESGALATAMRLLERDSNIQIRISEARKAEYQAAARAAGQSLSAWIIEACDRALS